MTCQMQAFLLLTNFELNGIMSHKYSLAAKNIFKLAASETKFWASLETNFFSIAGTLESETSANRKTQCLQVGVTFS